MNQTQTIVANRNASKRSAHHILFFYPHAASIAVSLLSKQGRQVLELIRRDGRVTRLTALHYGVANLTARIAELREVGFNINCTVKLDANGKEYGEWTEGKYAC